MCLWVCWIKPKVLGLFLDILAQVQKTAVNRQTGQFMALGESTSQVLSLPGGEGCARYSSLPEQWYIMVGIWQGLHQGGRGQLTPGRRMPVEERDAELLFGMILKGFYFK